MTASRGIHKMASRADLQRLADMTSAGETDAKIAAVLGWPEQKVKATRYTRKGILAELGLSRVGQRNMPYAFRNVDADAIVSAYSGGETSDAIARRHGAAPPTILNVLRKSGLQPRGKREAHQRYTVDECFFRSLTPCVEYWLGFLLADGCVTDKNTLCVGLHARDGRHLEALARVMNATYPVRYRYGRRDIASLSMPSRPALASDLARWGVTPRKTFTATVHPALQMSPHFWRGMVDGDGCIRPDSSAVVGTRAVCESFRAFVQAKFPGMHVGMRYTKPTLSEARVSGRLNIVKVLDLLYDGSTEETRLERKYEKYLHLKQNPWSAHRNA